LLLLEPIGAIFDDVCASAHSTAVRFLDHVAYLTITYYSTTTQKQFGREFALARIIMAFVSAARQDQNRPFYWS
jgi:hypothetical protein